MSPSRESHPVRKARVAKELRQSDLAEKAGISGPLISMIEGGYVPALSTMRAIARALDSTPVALWPDDVEEPDPEEKT